MKEEDIDAIVIHCSATKEGVDVKTEDIRRWHKANGWFDIGYNYVVELDGRIVKGRPLTVDGAHANTNGVSGRPYNKHSIGICYVGGLDKDGKPKDTRNDAQKFGIELLVTNLLMRYPRIKEVIGHRDCSPDANGDGVIMPNEWLKACPCFDVRAEYPEWQRVETDIKPGMA